MDDIDLRTRLFSLRCPRIESGKIVRVTLFFSQIIPKRSESEPTIAPAGLCRWLILYFSLYFRNESNAVPFEARIEIPHIFVRSSAPGKNREKERGINLKNCIE